MSPNFWRYMAQLLVGLFFAAAAYYKLTSSFFGLADVPLDGVFKYWIQQGFPLSVYSSFMELMMPYATILGAMTIAMQAAVGLMLIYNFKTRIAGTILFLIQINIFLATFNHRGFNVFVGTSVWLSLYFIFQPKLTGKRWWILSLVLISLDFLHLYNRYFIGDPWISAYSWQHTHFEQNVMSASPYLKQFFLFVTQGTTGMWLWASMWWVHLGLTVGLLMRYRLQAGAMLLVYKLLLTIFWVNTIGSEGVLWVLTLMVWLTHEVWLHKTGQSVELVDLVKFKISRNKSSN